VTPKLRKMEPIDQFTGSRKSKGKRTAASRARSGNIPRGTLETGKRTKKMVSAFNSIKKETNTRVYGNETSVMARALTGGTRPANLDESTQETG